MSSPKVFISYSWTSPQYQEDVMALADRLTKEGGIDVIIDEYDLKEGQDVVAFMERLKNDGSIHFCLVLSDAAYAEKANKRHRGVGTEAQIISKEVYDDIGQTRFVPVVMQRDENGNPCLPTFLQSRKYIDFSSLEMNQNWERLVRVLHGKPSRVKPEVGVPPSYLNEQSGGHFVGLRATWLLLKGALMEGKPAMAVLREDLLDFFSNEIDAASLQAIETAGSSADQVAKWEAQLRIQPEARDILLDWMLMEARIDPDRAVTKCIVPLLERINAAPRRNAEESIPSDWIDAMAVLAYETVLYALACLIETDSPAALRSLFEHPFSDRKRPDSTFRGLSRFRHYSEFAERWNDKQTQKWVSPLAHKFSERATHQRFGFQKLMEADALAFVYDILHDLRWYPALAAYVEGWKGFPWFAKAKASNNPDRLAIVTGRANWEQVRTEFLQKFGTALKGGGWTVFRYGGEDYVSAMCFGNSVE